MIARIPYPSELLPSEEQLHGILNGPVAQEWVLPIVAWGLLLFVVLCMVMLVWGQMQSMNNWRDPHATHRHQRWLQEQMAKEEAELTDEQKERRDRIALPRACP
jgi:hypothetical protein